MDTTLNCLKGRELTQELLSKLQEKYYRLRIRRPDTIVTFDFRATRLNVFVDEKNIIVRVEFG